MMPLLVKFSCDVTSVGCTEDPTFYWEFGDGETSTLQNPTHTYESTGEYIWTVLVTLEGNQCTQTGVITVEMNPTLPLLDLGELPPIDNDS